MKNIKNAIILCMATVFAASMFSITVSAMTVNTLSHVSTPRRDMDYANDLGSVPRLYLKADTDVNAGAVFLVELSQSAKWTLGSASGIAQFFTFSGGKYMSTAALTDASGFTYNASVISDSQMQITTNEILPADSYMAIPLIVKLDGIAEASATVSLGDAFGITSGTYVFANKGDVNEAKIQVSSSVNTEGDVIAGDIAVSLTAGLGNGEFTFTLPAGFAFDESNKNRIGIKTGGSYSSAKLASVSFNSSKSIMYVKIDNASKSTSSGKITIENVKVNALENAPDGEIQMNFSAVQFDVSNYKFKFGEYARKAVEKEPVEQEPVEQMPVTEPSELKVSATSGNKTVLIDGESYDMEVAPFNDEAGRMMVPLRFMANAFGMGDDAIKWDANKKEVTINFSNSESGKEIVFIIGSNEYTVNQLPETMDTAAVIKDGYTFIPVRYVADAMGLSINYSPEAKTAEFTMTLE